MKPVTKLAGGALALVSSGSLMLFSPGLQEHLGRWEGNGIQIVYADRLAEGLPTVCKGITPHTSPIPLRLGDRWTAQQCLDAERWVVSRDQTALARCIEVSVTQPVFDALSSHAHNFGVGSTCASRAVKLINAGDIPAGCDALAHAPDGTPVWSYVSRGARKEFVRGLYNRRLAERALCLSGLP